MVWFVFFEWWAKIKRKEKDRATLISSPPTERDNFVISLVHRLANSLGIIEWRLASREVASIWILSFVVQ